MLFLHRMSITAADIIYNTTMYKNKSTIAFNMWKLSNVVY